MLSVSLIYDNRLGYLRTGNVGQDNGIGFVKAFAAVVIPDAYDVASCIQAAEGVFRLVARPDVDGIFQCRAGGRIACDDNLPVGSEAVGLRSLDLGDLQLSRVVDGVGGRSAFTAVGIGDGEEVLSGWQPRCINVITEWIT